MIHELEDDLGKGDNSKSARKVRRVLRQEMRELSRVRSRGSDLPKRKIRLLCVRRQRLNIRRRRM